MEVSTKGVLGWDSDDEGDVVGVLYYFLEFHGKYNNGTTVAKLG